MAARAEEVKLDVMLAAFAKDYPGPSATLRRILDETPELRMNLLTAIGQEGVQHIRPMEGRGSAGHYDPEDSAVDVSITELKKAHYDTPVGRKAANGLRYTLGHEIQHSLDRDQILAQDSNIQRHGREMIAEGGPRDYTGLLRDYNAQSRNFEARAEIAGFNALASYVKAAHPDATLRQLYDASDSNMKMYIDPDPRGGARGRGPVAKGGLEIGENLKIERNEANLEAVGKLFYDPNKEYAKSEIGRGIRLLAFVEREAGQHAAETGPQAYVDRRALEIPLMRLPEGILDSRQMPQRVEGVDSGKRPRYGEPSEGATAPVPQRPRLSEVGTPVAAPRTPDQFGHPDHAFYTFLRERLPRETVPDNAVADAMSRAKEMRILDASYVADRQKGPEGAKEVALSDGVIWIGGNARAGFGNVGLQVSQARPMEEVVAQLETQRAVSVVAVPGVPQPTQTPHSQRH